MNVEATVKKTVLVRVKEGEEPIEMMVIRTTNCEVPTVVTDGKIWYTIHDVDGEYRFKDTELPYVLKMVLMKLVAAFGSGQGNKIEVNGSIARTRICQVKV